MANNQLDAYNIPIINNYTPYYYGCDGINDTNWGCGWRCIQMLLSQFGVEKDILTIAFETQDIVGEQFAIDVDSKKIHLADTTWIMLYVTNQAHQIGFDNVKFEMCTIQNMSDLPELYQKLQEHFLTETSMVVVTAGCATSLIAGIRVSDHVFDVYLVDPHVQINANGEIPVFDELKGFGKGGKGWINIKDIILNGKEEIGIQDDNEFLSNSSCLFGLFQNIFTFQ